MNHLYRSVHVGLRALPSYYKMDGLLGSMSRFLAGGLASVTNTLSRRLMGTQQHHPREQFTVVVEGNIGSGKTCLLQHFQDCPHAQVMTEPVNKWRDIEGHNALGAMYSDPARWSMTLQTYVQLTMMDQHIQPHTSPVKLMERSIYSAKYCFVENHFINGSMPEIEYVILTKWFDWIVAHQDTSVDLIVYLRTEPETVHERIKKRCRKEETAIPLDYLRQLHDLHEDWLINKTKFSLPAPVLVLDANLGLVEMVEQYNIHRDKILCGHS